MAWNLARFEIEKCKMLLASPNTYFFLFQNPTFEIWNPSSDYVYSVTDEKVMIWCRGVLYKKSVIHSGFVCVLCVCASWVSYIGHTPCLLAIFCNIIWQLMWNEFQMKTNLENCCNFVDLIIFTLVAFKIRILTPNIFAGTKEQKKRNKIWKCIATFICYILFSLSNCKMHLTLSSTKNLWPKNEINLIYCCIDNNTEVPNFTFYL